MDKTYKNKENIAQSGCISDMFRVKKCLFDQSISNKKTEVKSSNSDQQRNAESPMLISSYFESTSYTLNDIKRRKNSVETKDKESSPIPSHLQLLSESPMVLSPCLEDSPFSLFKIKKKSTAVKSKAGLYNGSVASSSIVTTPTNKKYSDEKNVVKKEDILADYQQSPNTIKLAVQRSMCDPNLTGDFSKQCILPTIQGRHPDLKTVSPSCVASLLTEPTSFKFTLIDCRYPYEYEGGHIQSAENIYMKEDIVKKLGEATTSSERKECKEVLIFYCEFSSERGPSMLRHLRNTDRDMNKDYYPFLYYPELYVMEGGYKAFFSSFKDLCSPQEYKRMLDKDCADQLAFYKSKCKSTTRSSKRLKRTRSALNF